MSRILRLAVFVFALAAATAAYAADPEQKTTPSADDPVCGRDMMTAEEMSEHRAKMRGSKTQAERDAYRAEHHAKMMERAKERGVKLDPAGCPMGHGMGMGPGHGRGPGGPGWHGGRDREVPPVAAPPPTGVEPTTNP